MSDATKPRQDAYVAGPGPFFEIEASSATDVTDGKMEAGAVISFSSGKAIPCAADAIDVAVSRGWRYDRVADKYYIQIDGTGALIKLTYTSAALGGVKMSDNQTCATTTDPTKWAGLCVIIDSTNVGTVRLRPLGSAPYAS